MLDKVMTWVEAVENGLSKYRCAKPCRRGHTPIRYVKSNSCVACVNLPYHKRKGRDISKEVTDAINTRDYALANGLKTYATGKPCVHGHIALRYTQSGGCSACINKTKIRKKICHRRVLCHGEDFKAIQDFAASLLKLREAGLR